jgi:hypothetical protein
LHAHNDADHLRRLGSELIELTSRQTIQMELRAIAQQTQSSARTASHSLQQRSSPNWLNLDRLSQPMPSPNAAR